MNLTLCTHSTQILHKMVNSQINWLSPILFCIFQWNINKKKLSDVHVHSPMWKNKTKREEQPKLIGKEICLRIATTCSRSRRVRDFCAIHDLARGCATRSSVFDRLSMPRVRRRTCFMGLNIANWVKSTRANDPNGSRGHRGRIGLGKKAEQLLGSAR